LEVGLLVENCPGGEATIGDGFCDRATVPTAWRTGCCWWAERDALHVRCGGETVDPRHRFGSCEIDRSDERGQVAGNVRPQPRGRLLRDAAERLDDELFVRENRDVGRGADNLSRQVVGVKADDGGLLTPGPVQAGAVDAMGLGRSGGEDRSSFELGDRAWVGVGAVVLVGPCPEQVGELALDLGAPGREQVTHRFGNAGGVGLPAVEWLPAESEARGELGTEGGVVDPADGALLLLEEASIEREPAAGRVLDLGADYGMGVQLRIDGAGGVLAEHSHGQAPGVDLEDAVLPPTGERPVDLEPVERRQDRSVMGGEHLGPHPRVRRERPQHRDRLRSRECRVEPPRRGITEPPAERTAGRGVAPFEQRPQVVRSDGAVEPERRASSAVPAPGRFVGIEVVVDRPMPWRRTPVVRKAGVVGEQVREASARRLQRRHPHHDPDHPRSCERSWSPQCTRLSDKCLGR